MMRALAGMALVVPLAVAAAPGERPAAGLPLECRISAKPQLRVGTRPVVDVRIFNRTADEIYLVGSLDASDVRWRYPHAYFEVTGPDGRPAVRGGARCGNRNALRAQDFVKIAPGASLDPYQRVDDYGFFATEQLSERTFAAVGPYRIRFHYSSAEPDLAQWMGEGPPRAELLRLFSRVPKVDVVSNEVILTVVDDDAHLTRR